MISSDEVAQFVEEFNKILDNQNPNKSDEKEKKKEDDEKKEESK